MRQVVWLIRK